MEGIISALMSEKAFIQTENAIEGGRCPVLITGVGGMQRAHMAAALRRRTGRPLVMVCADEAEAKRLCGDLQMLLGEMAYLLPYREFTFYNAESVSRQTEQRRLDTLSRLARGEAPVVVAAVDGFMQRTIPRDSLLSACTELRTDGTYDIDEVVGTLARAGYTRCQQVEGPGQFALRGGILDFFSPSEEEPVRCEFFGDEIDSMGNFDISTQRRTEMLRSAQILPAAETLPQLASGGTEGLIRQLEELAVRLGRRKNSEELCKNLGRDIERLKNNRTFPAADKYMELIYEMSSAADYIPEEAVVILCEPGRLKERADNFAWQTGEDVATLLENGALDSSLARFALSWEDALARLEDYPAIMMDNFTSGSYPLQPRTTAAISAKQLPSYGGSLETAAGDIAHYIRSKYRTAVLCQDKRRAEILKEYLDSQNIVSAYDFELREPPETGSCRIGLGCLSSGAEYPDSKLAVITEGQLLQTLFRRRVKKRPQTGRQKLDSFADLSPGDLVVHEHYGIGRFVGIVKMPVDKVEKDYVKIAFAGTDSLYVPATQLDLVSKYIGGGEDKPVKLSKMGGGEWVKAKSRAKSAAKDLAKGLIELQAERQRRSGHAFPPDSLWQEEFEEAFEYQETDDQLRSIKEIKSDMEKSVPMDRLLCGDVGYGKTEVALRAVMKCVLDGKQAAILVPTTVLAQQHYVTAIKRFSGYPVRIEMLSRFRSPAQIKGAVKNITDGTADIVIGTHKLIQKDVRFKDLGLLVVDEEQRFGVTHKERLKELSRQVDVLTLSATPIPRTLNMALSGLRDMSTIEEPPQDRQPVQTYVIEHDWGIIADAIQREVSRGGQVYYLHNRVENIDRTAARLSQMLEDVTVAIAHGQMEEESLNDVMQQMAAGEIQVLVCTTIIETGIDIPNVNTLIIEDADKLGLAQLHQIRGRVGRSNRRAYAYLTFRQGKVLSEVANKRLSAIREFAEFNSGFKIAMRDLEIRGAGNILGSEQSGHMLSVGFDMYLKLLEEAVLEEKGEKPELRTECSADLTVSAGIPETYIPSGEQRMDIYRRIAHIRTEEDADDMTDELIDRFGEPPKSVNTLIYVALLRGEAAAAGISDIAQKQGVVRFTITDFQLEQVSALYESEQFRGRIKIEAGTVPVISLRLPTGKDVLDEAVKFVRAFAAQRKSGKK